MPSPLGHALAGLSIAWVADAITPSRRRPVVETRSGGLYNALGGGFAIVCGLVAASPDLDVLIGSHRIYSHTLGAAVLAGLLAALCAVLARLPVVRTGIVCGAAYATHVLLDWLGKDSASPHGIMALWPLSSAFYTSGANLFFEISRRYWTPDEFILGNAQSIGWEMVVMLPIAAAAWGIRRRRGTRG